MLLQKIHPVFPYFRLQVEPLVCPTVSAIPPCYRCIPFPIPGRGDSFAVRFMWHIRSQSCLVAPYFKRMFLRVIGTVFKVRYSVEHHRSPIVDSVRVRVAPSCFLIPDLQYSSAAFPLCRRWLLRCYNLRLEHMLHVRTCRVLFRPRASRSDSLSVHCPLSKKSSCSTDSG